MNKSEAAKVLYGYVPEGDQRPLQMMDCAQDQWTKPGIRDTWRDDAWHAVWWILHALVHDDRKAIETGKAYLELAKRG